MVYAIRNTKYEMFPRITYFVSPHYRQLHNPIQTEGALFVFEVTIGYYVGGLLAQRDFAGLDHSHAMLAVVTLVAYA